jgi:hypothetical protein
LPVVVHGLPLRSCGHCGVAHVFVPVQVTSHLHELLQSTWPHELAPLQTTTHDVPFAHVTDAHEFGCEQSTTQFQPAGQLTAAPPTIMHVIVEGSHDAHAAGQLPPSSNTQ